MVDNSDDNRIMIFKTNILSLFWLKCARNWSSLLCFLMLDNANPMVDMAYNNRVIKWPKKYEWFLLSSFSLKWESYESSHYCFFMLDHAKPMVNMAYNNRVTRWPRISMYSKVLMLSMWMWINYMWYIIYLFVCVLQFFHWH